jgi:hypothetical protein
MVRNGHVTAVVHISDEQKSIARLELRCKINVRDRPNNCKLILAIERPQNV